MRAAKNPKHSLYQQGSQKGTNESASSPSLKGTKTNLSTAARLLPSMGNPFPVLFLHCAPIAAGSPYLLVNQPQPRPPGTTRREIQLAY